MSGMAEGAATGAAAGCILTYYLCPVGAVAGAIIGAVVGAPVGAGLAAPDLVDDREAALRQIAGTLALGQALRDRIAALGRERTGIALEPMPSSVEPGEGAKAIQTRLEVTVERVALVGLSGVTPPVGLDVRIRSSLVRVEDGAELHAQSLTFQGRSREVVEWTEARLRVDLAWALDALAERVFDEVFLVRTPWP
jgi:hypothetical protein